jgi:hypothetical protein
MTPGFAEVGPTIANASGSDLQLVRLLLILIDEAECLVIVLLIRSLSDT